MSVPTTVSSQKNPLAYMKAIATLVGTIATGLLAVYTTDTTVGQVLTVLVIIATAVTTWVVPNAVVVPSEEATAVAVAVERDALYGTQEPLRQPGSDDEGFGGDAPLPTPYSPDDPHRY